MHSMHPRLNTPGAQLVHRLMLYLKYWYTRFFSSYPQKTAPSLVTSVFISYIFIIFILLSYGSFAPAWG